tara:strand:- start:91 stop:669 length:579 start_codon:yes stop_codon:yes gene_type:complete
MVNVKSYSCFPTMIYEFNGVDKANHLKMLNIVDFENEDNNDNLQNHLAFISFSNKVIEYTKEIIRLNQYEYEKVEITNMWANTLRRKESHPPHTHSNNIFSGVYYLRSSDTTSPIQFFDPRPQASVFKPRNTPNWNNSSMIQFDSVEGKGFIFPSWLMHWVPPTDDERVSISWNVIIRGDYGEPNTLQNAHI